MQPYLIVALLAILFLFLRILKKNYLKKNTAECLNNKNIILLFYCVFFDFNYIYKDNIAQLIC